MKTSGLSLKYTATAFAFITLTGCANLQPILPRTAPLEANSAYIAGTFSGETYHGFAFVIQSLDNQKKYYLSMSGNQFIGRKQDHLTTTIKIPAGHYTIKQWLTYERLLREVMVRKPMDEHPVLGKPFQLKAGDVLHLGSYDLEEKIENRYASNTYFFFIKPELLTQHMVQEQLSNAYPSLAQQPFTCLFCIDTIPQLQKDDFKTP